MNTVDFRGWPEAAASSNWTPFALTFGLGVPLFYASMKARLITPSDPAPPSAARYLQDANIVAPGSVSARCLIARARQEEMVLRWRTSAPYARRFGIRAAR